ncbi:hypothetical protein [Cohnella terricola]|uniref:hypothetical protein n=1 Tax=Cohnella terricola TaxID=1289167 RepID=UPI0016482916|nr:hypothetical protein [Cohnella terricola]
MIIPLLNDGVKGNVYAAREANRLLERLRLDYPANPLADAYHGSAMMLIARDSTDPLDKLSYSEKGLELLDKAVAAAPRESRIRLLRGKAAFPLPEEHFFRTRTVIEDYAFLLEQESLQADKLKDVDYAKITFDLGEAFRRIGRHQDAAKCWTKLEQQTQDPEFRQLLQQKLLTLEDPSAIEPVESNHTNFSTKSILLGTIVRAAGQALHKWVEDEDKREALRAQREEEKKYDSRSKRRYEPKRYDSRSSRRDEPKRYDSRSSRRDEPKRYDSRSSRRDVPKRYDSRSSRRDEPKKYDSRSSRRDEPKRYESRSSRRDEPKRYDSRSSRRDEPKRKKAPVSSTTRRSRRSLTISVTKKTSRKRLPLSVTKRATKKTSPLIFTKGKNDVRTRIISIPMRFT